MRAILLAFCLALPASAQDTLPVGPFSTAPAGSLPEAWQALEFPAIERHTEYTPVVEDGVQVIRASSDQAASGLIRELRLDPHEYPLLRWRWKVAGIIPVSNPRHKAGDDYPARLYVTFDYPPDRLGFGERIAYKAMQLFYGSAPPLRALNYIWTTTGEPDTFIPSAYTRHSRMVIVRSGAAQAGQWMEEERNVLEDYRRAFGEEPPAITGVAIMTDTDNTGSTATAWYGDIVFRRAP